jgi:hypothetical protein
MEVQGGAVWAYRAARDVVQGVQDAVEVPNYDRVDGGVQTQHCRRRLPEERLVEAWSP